MCAVWLCCVCGILYVCMFMRSVCILFVLYGCIVCVVLYVCLMCVECCVWCLVCVCVQCGCMCIVRVVYLWGLCVCLRDMCGVGVGGL